MVLIQLTFFRQTKKVKLDVKGIRPGENSLISHILKQAAIAMTSKKVSDMVLKSALMQQRQLSKKS